jgi:hypothetical protein
VGLLVGVVWDWMGFNDKVGVYWLLKAISARNSLIISLLTV